MPLAVVMEYDMLLCRSAEKMEGVNVIVSGQFDRQLEKFYSVCDKLQICLVGMNKSR